MNLAVRKPNLKSVIFRRIFIILRQTLLLSEKWCQWSGDDLCIGSWSVLNTKNISPIPLPGPSLPQVWAQCDIISRLNIWIWNICEIWDDKLFARSAGLLFRWSRHKTSLQQTDNQNHFRRRRSMLIEAVNKGQLFASFNIVTNFLGTRFISQKGTSGNS